MHMCEFVFISQCLLPSLPGLTQDLMSRSLGRFSSMTAASSKPRSLALLALLSLLPFLYGED